MRLGTVPHACNGLCHPLERKTSLSFMVLVCCLFLAAHSGTAVKIKSLRVPDTVVLSANRTSAAATFLDCNYDLNPKESGLVLKWYLNDQLVYQWIPDRQPLVFNAFKDFIHVNETNARGLTLRDINLNISGNYRCNVQTFESTDERKAHLQVMVPEDSFEMEQIVTSKVLLIRCLVKNVYPEPKLIIMLGSDYLIDQSKRTKQNPDESYNVSMLAKVHKKSISKNPIVITCILTIPQTSYIKKKESIYYDVESDFFDDNTLLGRQFLSSVTTRAYQPFYFICLNIFAAFLWN